MSHRTQPFYTNESDALRRRAETAESALLEARRILRWLDNRGGLGLDVHERIRSALSTDPTKGAQP